MKTKSRAEKRTKRINLHFTDTELAKFLGACAVIRFKPAHVLRSLTRAFAEHLRVNGCVSYPLRLRDE